MNTVASLPASLPAKLTDLVRRLRDGDWNMRTPEELAECVADAIMEALATPAVEGGLQSLRDELTAMATKKDVQVRLDRVSGIMERIRLATAEQAQETSWLYRGQEIDKNMATVYNLLTDRAEAREPDGYHYVYPWPFNNNRTEVIVKDGNGGEWNGQKPLRSVPYYYTTPPPEQGDALALLREIRATGVGLNEHWLARVDAVLANATQPEARGVEDLPAQWDEMASSYAGDVRLMLTTCAAELRLRLAATPNPVRAEQPDCRCVDCGGDQPKHDPTCSYMRELTGEQPEVQGDDPGRMAIRLLVAAGHVTEAKANEALCIAHGFEPGPLAPAAPVGVDEATQDAIDSILHRLNGWAQAYPESVFGPVTDAERKEHGSLISRASASMGRHITKMIAADLTKLTAALAGKAQEGPNG